MNTINWVLCGILFAEALFLLSQILKINKLNKEMKKELDDLRLDYKNKMEEIIKDFERR